eukprot:scaffold233568_cov17-Tisochrysis_lutea.AAC.1
MATPLTLQRLCSLLRMTPKHRPRGPYELQKWAAQACAQKAEQGFHTSRPGARVKARGEAQPLEKLGSKALKM